MRRKKYTVVATDMGPGRRSEAWMDGRRVVAEIHGPDGGQWHVKARGITTMAPSIARARDAAGDILLGRHKNPPTLTVAMFDPVTKMGQQKVIPALDAGEAVHKFLDKVKPRPGHHIEVRRDGRLIGQWFVSKGATANPCRNPRVHGMDAYDREHLRKWLEATVPGQDRIKVGAAIRRLVKEDPLLLVIGNKSWPEIRRMAERAGYL